MLISVKWNNFQIITVRSVNLNWGSNLWGSGTDAFKKQKIISGGYKLRIDLEDIHGKTAFAEYSSFSVTSERAK